MKKFLVILLLFSIAFMIFGKKVAVFEDIYDLKYFYIDGNDLFTVDGESIKHFSIKDLQLIRIIGKKGEGPGEFKMTPMFQLFSDHIFVNDYGKILFFKRDGTLIGEKKTSSDISLEKVGANYLSTRDAVDMKKGVAVSTHSILDQDLNELKELFSTNREFKISSDKNGKREMKLFRSVKRCFTDGEHIFVMDTTKGFYFEILDHNGNLLSTVNRKTKKIRISKKFKKELMKEFMELKSWNKWGRKFNHIFPEYFPPFSHISGDKNRIYVYSQVGNVKKALLVIFDHKGNFLKGTGLL